MLEIDFSFAREHAIYQLLNAPVRGYPSPHSCIENFFPADFYRQIQFYMMSKKELKPITLGKVGGDNIAYEERNVLVLPSNGMNALQGVQRTFWDGLSELLNSIELQTAMLHKFQPLVDQRLGPDLGGDVSFNTEVLFVQDKGNYKIGPHTDSPLYITAMLIYLRARKTISNGEHPSTRRKTGISAAVAASTTLSRDIIASTPPNTGPIPLFASSRPASHFTASSRTPRRTPRATLYRSALATIRYPTPSSSLRQR